MTYEQTIRSIYNRMKVNCATEQELEKFKSSIKSLTGVNIKDLHSDPKEIDNDK